MLKSIPLSQTYMRFHRMHVMTSTAMEEMKPMAADRITTTSVATTTPRENSSQLPHTGRQSEVFPTILQEKPSWHWSVLQLTCPANPADGGGWVVVSPFPPLPLPACGERWNSITKGGHLCVTCRSVCDMDQNGIKWWILWAIWSMCFSDTKEVWLIF